MRARERRRAAVGWWSMLYVFSSLASCSNAFSSSAQIMAGCAARCATTIRGFSLSSHVSQQTHSAAGVRADRARSKSMKMNNRRRREPEVPCPLNGVFAVYKPTGWTSADVVTKVRNELERGLRLEAEALASPPPLPASEEEAGANKRYLRKTRVQVKVGHGGTLDPLATGVLVLGVGNGTKTMGQLLHGAKAYKAVGRFGAETDTLDREGKVIEERDAAHVTWDALEMSLDTFRGDIMQIPPMYSALKKKGKKLYELAREGIEVEREPRPVTISSLEAFEHVDGLPNFCLDIVCSGGTYIRSLIADIARALDTRGIMMELERTQQGPFVVEDCLRREKWNYETLVKVLAGEGEVKVAAADSSGSLKMKTG